MNSTSITHTDLISRRSVRERYDQLEAHMWDRARANLMLLYNGSQMAGTTAQTVAPPQRLVGPLAVLDPEA